VICARGRVRICVGVNDGHWSIHGRDFGCWGTGAFGYLISRARKKLFVCLDAISAGHAICGGQARFGPPLWDPLPRRIYEKEGRWAVSSLGKTVCYSEIRWTLCSIYGEGRGFDWVWRCHIASAEFGPLVSWLAISRDNKAPVRSWAAQTAKNTGAVGDHYHWARREEE